MRRNYWLLTGLLAACAIGCGDDENRGHGAVAGGGEAGQGGSAAGGTVGTVESGFECSASDKTLADCDANELFDYAKVPVIDLTLPQAAWEALNKNAVDEEYTEAIASFEGQRIGAVGLRFKGSYGTLVECFDASGSKICSKLSMKLKFNEYDPAGRFFGLKRLNLHSMRYDASHLHDRVAYRVYRAMGVQAPRSSWATLRVNGETQGLFAMVEQVDGRFTNDRWSAQGDGNLYKEVMFSYEDPAYFSAVSEPTLRDAYTKTVSEYRTDAYYTGQLETNEATADHAALLSFSQDLAAASASDQRAVLKQYMDVDYLARYMAVDDAVYNWDGITAIYTGDDFTWSIAHNYYLYQEPEKARFHLIPWDMDGAMNPSNGFGLIPHWTEQPTDCTKLYPVFGGQNYVLAPGCVPLFQALRADLRQYQAAVKELLAGPFAEATLKAQIEKDAAFIEAAVAADPFGPSLAAWKSSVEQLLRDIPTLRKRVQQLAAGQKLTPLTFGATTVTDFETVGDFDVLVGPLMMTNANSNAQQSLNTTEALVGSKDLKLDFEYKNETKAWDQWMYFSIPLTEGNLDARSLTGIRLWVRADQSRTLRLELESPAQTATDAGVRNGWDISAGPVATAVEVTLAKAAVPSWAVEQGVDPKNSLDAVLATITGLAFHPYCVGRDNSGFLPEGTSDQGWVQIDNVEFF